MQLNTVDNDRALHAAAGEQEGLCGGCHVPRRSTSHAPSLAAPANTPEERPSLRWQQRQQQGSVGGGSEAEVEAEVEGDADAEAEALAALSHLRANLEPFLHLSEEMEVGPVWRPVGGLVVGANAGLVWY